MQTKVESTRQQAVDATQLAIQAQSVVQFALTTVSAYETKLGEIQHTVDQLQQLVINERKSRMKMESQLSAAQDKIGAAETRTQLLEQKNETSRKSWIVGMRIPHQNLLQMCNLLPVVVDFLLLACLYLKPMLQCQHLFPCQ